MDEFFNERYAQRVVKMLSGMDPDAAEMMTRFVVHDVLDEHIQANSKIVSKRVSEIMDSIREQVAKAALSGGDATATAALVGLVSKSDEWNNGDPDWVTRDMLGRFSSGGNGSLKIKARSKDGKNQVKITSSSRDFNLTGALAADKKKGNAFADQWNDPGRAGTNQRTYNRISAGSRLLADSSDPRAKAIGEVGQFVGSFGPEAEKVIGPTVRRTAYRYRGTEKQLDPKINEAMRNEVRGLMRDQTMERPSLTGGQRAALTRRANEEFKNRKEGDTRTISEIRNQLFTSASNAQTPRRAALSPEQRSQAAQSVAVGYLSERLPKSSLSSLQTSSGKIPPSEGLLINDEGRIVAQAVGYQEDHYLPFNLKNLKGLQGGSYVRTRSSGGLTTEDIYTGLVAGARSVTVVSRSGTFTLEFEDDFRGVRRYGDVARQMTERYAKTLDAVESRTIERVPLDAMEVARIRAGVEAEYSAYAGTSRGRAMIEERVRDAVKEAKTSTELTVSEVKDIEEEAKRQAAMEFVPSRWMNERTPQTKLPTTNQEKYEYIRNELISSARNDKENRTLQLDGLGYETALNALKEQYPYFIKDVRSNPYSDPENKKLKSRETDSGYVRPNYNRPKAVKEGYFDSDIEGLEPGKSGKYSAAQTNYQNAANLRRRRIEPQGESETPEQPQQEAPQPSAKASLDAEPDARRKARMSARQTVAGDEALAEAALTALDHASPGSYVPLRDLAGGSSVTDREQRKERMMSALSSVSNREKVLEQLNNFNSALSDQVKKEPANSTLASVLSSLTSGVENANRYYGQAESSSKGAELMDNFERSPAQPASFDNIKSGDHEALDRVRDSLGTLRARGDEIQSETNDATLRRSSSSSLDLAKIFDRVAEGKASESDFNAAQRVIAADKFLRYSDKADEPSRDELAVYQLEDLLSAAGGDSAELKNTAKTLADTHRARAREIEMLRALNVAEEETTQQLMSNKPVQKNLRRRLVAL